MAIDAKVSFLRQLSKELEGVLTVEQMDKMNARAMEIMDHFDMRENSWDDGQPDDLLGCYVDAMKVQGRSQMTINRYVYVIGRLMKSVKVPTRKITVYHLRNFLTAEKARGVQDSTLEGIRQVFSSYFNWLQRESLIERNPMANLGTIKCEKKVKKAFTDSELERLDRNCHKLRDRAVLHFLRATGCRISEATGLNRDCVNLEKQEAIVHGKGNKQRKVFMDEIACDALRAYLDSRTDEAEALFLNRFGERILPGGVRTMLKELAKLANVDHVHPHKFRRTLATEMTRKGMPIQAAARILGHEKIDTTNRYVAQNDDDIRFDYRRYA